MAAVPSVKQMINRANSGHLKALRAYRDGTLAVGPTEPDSAVRGMMTVLRTLRGWGCVEGDVLTDRGCALLAALEQRDAEYNARMGWS